MYTFDTVKFFKCCFIGWLITIYTLALFSIPIYFVVHNMIIYGALALTALGSIPIGLAIYVMKE